jgi:hypothetical protein
MNLGDDDAVVGVASVVEGNGDADGDGDAEGDGDETPPAAVAPADDDG